MKKIIAFCVTLLIAVQVFAGARKSYVLGLGESIHFDSYAEGKDITPATMVTFEEWMNWKSAVGVWYSVSAGKASSLIELPAGSASYIKYDLGKGFMLDGSAGLSLNLDRGAYTLNVGVGPHMSAHLMEIIRTATISSGEYGLIAGLCTTIEGRFKLGSVLFLAVGCPVSYDLFRMNNSDVTDYRRITVAPFAAVGFTH